MWLFTTLGFYSITRSRLEPEMFQIRARCRRHLQSLSEHMDGVFLTPGYLGTIHDTPFADYRWRYIVNETRAMAAVMELAHLITYSNFKDAAARTTSDLPYRAALHDVWARMERLQRNLNQEQPHA